MMLIGERTPASQSAPLTVCLLEPQHSPDFRRIGSKLRHRFVRCYIYYPSVALVSISLMFLAVRYKPPLGVTPLLKRTQYTPSDGMNKTLIVKQGNFFRYLVTPSSSVRLNQNKIICNRNLIKENPQFFRLGVLGIVDPWACFAQVNCQANQVRVRLGNRPTKCTIDYQQVSRCSGATRAIYGGQRTIQITLHL